MKNNGITVSEYSLKAARTGKHVRWATRVTFPNGRSVDFMEPMTQKAAISQAESVLYSEYVGYWRKCYQDVEPMSREHYLNSLRKEAA